MSRTINRADTEINFKKLSTDNVDKNLTKLVEETV